MAPSARRFSPEVLRIDPERVADEIARWLVEIVGHLRRRGAVVGLSGGVDSSVVAALCVRAFGSDRVCGVLTPETDSAAETLPLSQLAARTLGISTVLEEITPMLSAIGCYRRRDEAVRTVVPEYGDGWKMKIALPPLVGSDRYRLFSLVVESPEGERRTLRLSSDAYATIVAATSFKQRTRKMIEYYHSDRLRFAVVGTPNLLEYELGFFVKHGDGAADVKPIAHLYKSQVYQLAEYLDVPTEIRQRVPTTDTYSLAQTQEEFYFSLPYRSLDLCLYASTHGIEPPAVAQAVGLAVEDIERVFADIQRKREAARYLHAEPYVVTPQA